MKCSLLVVSNIFTFCWVPLVVLFPTKLVSGQSEFSNSRYRHLKFASYLVQTGVSGLRGPESPVWSGVSGTVFGGDFRIRAGTYCIGVRSQVRRLPRSLRCWLSPESPVLEDRSLRCWKTGVSGLVGSWLVQVIQMGGPEASPEVGPKSPVYTGVSVLTFPQWAENGQKSVGL